MALALCSACGRFARTYHTFCPHCHGSLWRAHIISVVPLVVWVLVAEEAV